jgi:hypothetical protein
MASLFEVMTEKCVALSIYGGSYVFSAEDVYLSTDRGARVDPTTLLGWL